MEQIFFNLSKSDFQDLIAGIVNACLRRYLPPPTPSQPEKYITRKEAAQMLCVTLPTLLKYTLEGRITGYRIGGRVLYKVNEIAEAAKAISTNKKTR